MTNSTNNATLSSHEKLNLSLETTKEETTSKIEPSSETDDTPAINQTGTTRTNIEETATSAVTQQATPPHQLAEQCSNREEGESEEREVEAAAANEEEENVGNSSEVDESVVFIEER